MANNRAALTLALIALAACSDSQRRATVAVEPPPPAAPVDTMPPPPPPVPPLRVSPRQVAFNALNDTARIAIPEGAECRSASDAVAVIEHGSLLRAVGNGTTHVRCWLEGSVGSVKVTVAQELARVAIVAEQGFSIRRNGDSLRFVFQLTDRLGQPVRTAPEASWQSLSPEVVQVNATGTAVGLADSGRARIVAAAGGMSDTVTVEIGLKSVASQLLTTSSRNASRARLLARQRGARPTLVAGPGGVINQSVTSGTPQQQQQNPSGINARPITTGDSLFQDPALGLGGGRRFIVPFAAARMAEHRLDRVNDSLGRTSGLLIGGGADILTRGLLSFRFQFLAGTLGAEDSLASDRTVLDASLDVGFALSPWLNIVGGVSSRRFEEALGIERFLSVRAGGEANFSLGGGPLRGIARVLIMPLVSIASSQSAAESPSFGIVSALGLGFENRRLSSSLVYEIERYSFPATVGRKEQFGSLLFRFGYKVGW